MIKTKNIKDLSIEELKGAIHFITQKRKGKRDLLMTLQKELALRLSKQ